MGSLGGIPFEVGDVLAKKYRLERLVGEGGTGLVVSAQHLTLERRVAIKFLRTALASDEIRLRFEREARAIAQIESEHVVLVFDVGALDDGSPFMVMEFLEGRDLARILKEDGPLPIEDSIDCMLQVCEALAQAHAAGIVHRDLKPANLFLTRREDGAPHVKVVDFGISKILDPKLLQGDGGPKEMTSAFTVLGSPRYMAPEQLRNSKEVDARADLWSVGAVLFQLVTGQHAFEADSNVHVSLAVLTKEPALLRELAPHAPRELEAIVNRCLTKDVRGRFQSARELADALRPLASERTRESLERLAAAKEEPNLAIALSSSSVMPPSGAPGSIDHQAPRSRRPPPMPGARGMQPTLPDAYHRSPPPPASSSSAFVSSYALPGAPSSEPVLARGRSARKSPRTAMKIALALGGLLAVLIAFGMLSALKMAAEAAGLIAPAAEQARPPARSDPASAAPTARAEGPSRTVVAPADAGGHDNRGR